MTADAPGEVDGVPVVCEPATAAVVLDRRSRCGCSACRGLREREAAGTPDPSHVLDEWICPD